MYFVVSYDITNDKKRTKVMKILKDHGKHVQYSVFECDLSYERLTKMMTKIKKHLDLKQDSIRIYPMCEKCRNNIHWEGDTKDFTIEKVIIV